MSTSSHTASRGNAFLKVLFVHDMLEKDTGLWGKMLEDATKQIFPVCAFTVSPNAFHALEQMEITRFDLVIIQEALPAFSGLQFIEVMRNMKSSTPFIVLSEAQAFSQILHTVEKSPGFYGIINFLSIDFTPTDLCSTIIKTLKFVNVTVEYLTKKKQSPRPRRVENNPNPPLPVPQALLMFQPPLMAPKNINTSHASPREMSLTEPSPRSVPELEESIRYSTYPSFPTEQKMQPDGGYIAHTYIPPPLLVSFPSSSDQPLPSKKRPREEMDLYQMPLSDELETAEDDLEVSDFSNDDFMCIFAEDHRRFNSYSSAASTTTTLESK